MKEAIKALLRLLRVGERAELGAVPRAEAMLEQHAVARVANVS